MHPDHPTVYCPTCDNPLELDYSCWYCNPDPLLEEEERASFRSERGSATVWFLVFLAGVALVTWHLVQQFTQFFGI